MSPSRAQHREAVERRIVEIGRRHLASEGAAGLSLRAVTRELGMVSSAVYRYVANRDELLTLLVVDAYTELADTVDDAVSRAGGRWDERVVAAGLAFRIWAAGEPARYALLYGSPVPGYEAPAERTTGPGTRVALVLAGLVGEGVAAGDVAAVGRPPVTAEQLGTDLVAAGDELGLTGGADVVARAMTLWATLVGATSLEVFGQYGAAPPGGPGELVEQQLRIVLEVVRG